MTPAATPPILATLIAVAEEAGALALAHRDAGLSVTDKVWDVAPVLPVLEALGFGLYRWPDLAGPPAEILDLSDEGFYRPRPAVDAVPRTRRGRTARGSGAAGGER